MQAQNSIEIGLAGAVEPRNALKNPGARSWRDTKHTRSAPIPPFYPKLTSFPPFSLDKTLGSFTQKLRVYPKTPIWNKYSKQLKEILNTPGIHVERC